MNGLKKEFLQKLGFDDSNTWISMFNPSCTEFFLWLQENISPEKNILEFGEIKEYEDLKTRNQLLSDDEVATILKEAEAKYPGISGDLDAEIEKAEEELRNLTELEGSYRKLETEMGCLEKEVDEEEMKLSLHFAQQKEKFESSMEKAVSSAQQLEKLEAENVELFQKLQDAFINKKNPPIFMVQAPMYRFNKKCFQFQSELDELLAADPLFTSSEDATKVDVTEVAAAKGAYLKAQMDLLDEQLNAATLEKAQNIVKFVPIPRTLDDLRNQLYDYETSNGHLESEIENSMEEVHSEMEKATLLKVETILEDKLQHKYNRAEQRVQKLRTIKDSINELVNAAEIIWICLQLEKNQLSTFTACSNNGDVQKRVILFEKLSKLKSKNEELARDKVIKVFQDFLGCDSADFAELVARFCEVFDSVSGLFGDLVAQTAVYPRDSLSELEEMETLLKGIVYGGPLDQVEVVDPRLKHLLQENEARMKENDQEYRRIQTKFQLQYQEPRNKDRFCKLYSRLWCWFLTEPKQVLEAIKQISEAVKKLPVQEKFISGIRRQ